MNGFKKVCYVCVNFTYHVSLATVLHILHGIEASICSLLQCARHWGTEQCTQDTRQDILGESPQLSVWEKYLAPE